MMVVQYHSAEVNEYCDVRKAWMRAAQSQPEIGTGQKQNWSSASAQEQTALVDMVEDREACDETVDVLKTSPARQHAPDIISSFPSIHGVKRTGFRALIGQISSDARRLGNNRPGLSRLSHASSAASSRIINTTDEIIISFQCCFRIRVTSHYCPCSLASRYIPLHFGALRLLHRGVNHHQRLQPLRVDLLLVNDKHGDELGLFVADVL